MGELHFYQRPWFYLVFPPVLVIIMVLVIALMGSTFTGYLGPIVRALVAYFGLLLLWLAFFAQFILPVETFWDRQKIFDRLMAYLLGLHGPALFIRNGELVERDGEKNREGPGVIWLDSASGVVTRTAEAFKNTFGPGVHFTQAGEKIGGIVDLHIQRHSIGPRDNEDPFAEKSAEQSDLDFKFIQDRRIQTSALTRDGIEIVPNISVLFKIDAEPVSDPSLPGSRFGFDADAVRLAITGEAINPDVPRDSHRYRIPWNQLPALLAADVWRDLVSKFTLNELFLQEYSRPHAFSDPPDESPMERSSGKGAIRPQGTLATLLTGLLKELSRLVSETSNRIERYCRKPATVTPARLDDAKKSRLDEGKLTGLQVINFLLKERLQRHKAAQIDQYGKYQGEGGKSKEFEFLKSRGIRILSVSVSNIRLLPAIDKRLINQWTASWLARAREERDRLEQEDGFNRIHNEEVALRDYVLQLSNDLLLQLRRNRARDLRETLRVLMLESRVMLVHDAQLRRYNSQEREALEEILQWLETGSDS